ncbi:MAG: hypothetical protein JW920_01990 [Deltaproteobacteria bacterium]|nr:hypothetical protein [Deltaproteobacteria bacterium]
MIRQLLITDYLQSQVKKILQLAAGKTMTKKTTGFNVWPVHVFSLTCKVGLRRVASNLRRKKNG